MKPSQPDGISRAQHLYNNLRVLVRTYAELPSQALHLDGIGQPIEPSQGRAREEIQAACLRERIAQATQELLLQPHGPAYLAKLLAENVTSTTKESQPLDLKSDPRFVMHMCQADGGY